MRSLARKVYVVGIWLLVAAVLVQFLLAGLGIFLSPEFLFWHAAVNASLIFVLPLLLVLVGWLGRVPGRTLGLTAIITGLVIVQSLLLIPYHMSAPGPLRALASLHVLNALLIVWIALRLLERTGVKDALA